MGSGADRALWFSLTYTVHSVSPWTNVLFSQLDPFQVNWNDSSCSLLPVKPINSTFSFLLYARSSVTWMQCKWSDGLSWCLPKVCEVPQDLWIQKYLLKHIQKGWDTILVFSLLTWELKEALLCILECNCSETESVPIPKAQTSSNTSEQVKSNISPKWQNVKSIAEGEFSLLAEVCSGKAPQAALWCL